MYFTTLTTPIMHVTKTLVKPYTLLTLLISIFTSTTTKAQIAFQGFESSGSDTWNFTSNIPLYTLNTDTDVWNVYSGSLGVLNGAKSGSFYFAGRDLDNPYSETETGSGNPEHILTFDAINIGGASVDFSFWCNFNGYDSSDYIFYELAFDNGSDWASPDVHVDIVANPSGSNLNSSGDTWENFNINIPAGNQYVRIRIVAYQNGASDYVGFDDFSLTSSLSTKEVGINGFHFYPNPIKDMFHFSATNTMDSIKIFNNIGQEVVSRSINSSKSIIDLRHLKSGIYFAEIISGNIKEHLKLIKE